MGIESRFTRRDSRDCESGKQLSRRGHRKRDPFRWHPRVHINQTRHAAKAQRKWLAAHALPEEKAVVEVYRRQEDRIGRSRKRKVAISKNGEVLVGYVSDAEPSIVNFTDHGLAGKRAKRPWLAPVPESGGCWHGVGDLPEDCRAAMQAVRAVYQAEGFTVAAKGMDRVPQGGHAYAPPEPTVAEGWVHWMDDGTESDWAGCPLPEKPEVKPAWFHAKVVRRNRLQRVACRLMSEKPGGYSELVPIDVACVRPEKLADKQVVEVEVKEVDLRKRGACGKPAMSLPERVRYVLNRRGKAGEPMIAHVRGSGSRALQRVPDGLPRSRGESPTGPYETRWRPVATKRWKKPQGMAPAPVAWDAEMIALVNLAAGLGRWKAAGCLLPILANRTHERRVCVLHPPARCHTPPVAFLPGTGSAGLPPRAPAANPLLVLWLPRPVRHRLPRQRGGATELSGVARLPQAGRLCPPPRVPHGV